MEAKWLVIVNPNAGSRKGERDWPEIYQLLRQKDFLFEHVFSEYHRHSISIAQKGIENGFRHIIAVGGDGTINEVVNGIFRQNTVPSRDVTLATIPVGTGNDWGRMFDIPSSYQESIDIIAEGNTFLQDAGMVTYCNGEGNRSRYFINIAGIGFDALVAKKTNSLKEKGKGNTFSYLISLFSGLLRYKHRKAEITVGESRETMSTHLFSMNVGICQYNGGGMKQVPNAIPDDGLFDLTIISKMKKVSMLRHVGKIFKGTHLRLPSVSSYRTPSVFIDARSPVRLEVDGESLGHSPMEFTVIPKSITVVVGT
ncbi:MAG: diacylglycerol kinase family lipid kinase [Bacteroidales bacterium]